MERRSLVISLGCHVGVAMLAWIGLPSIKRALPDEQPIVVLEMVQSVPKTNLKQGYKPNTAKLEQKASRKKKPPPPPANGRLALLKPALMATLHEEAAAHATAWHRIFPPPVGSDDRAADDLYRLQADADAVTDLDAATRDFVSWLQHSATAKRILQMDEHGGDRP